MSFPDWSTPRKLAALAGALAVMAFAFDRPSTGVDLNALALDVERELDHVSAVELAEWISDRKPGLRIIDVRERASFDEFQLPLAEHVPMGEITRIGIDPEDTIVLYSDAGTHAAQAWFFLRARGLRNVFFLQGGANEWIETIVNPRPPVNPTPDEQRAWQHQRELSKYFGGQVNMEPASAGGGAPEASFAEKVKALKRRGC